MLVELETSLVSFLRSSPLAPRLRAIDALPDLDGERLISRFGAEAPALYVALGAGEFPGRGVARPQIGLACICRNSRSAQAARQGDGLAIGLLELIEAAMTLLDGALIDGREFEVIRWDMLADAALYRQGMYAAVVQLRTTDLLPQDYSGEAP